VLVVILALLTLALPLFLYGTFYVARGILFGLRSTEWRETSGVILLSKVEQYYRGKNVAKEMLHLFYHYTVDGDVRQGTRVSFNNFAWFFGDLKKLEARYPQDREVTVYYDPLKPENAVLENGIARADITLLCVLALIDAGILLIWIPLRPVLFALGVALIIYLILLFRVLRQLKGSGNPMA
jgi:hypothetical protein